MKVLIVGSTGYIGSNLVKHLSSKGYYVIAGSRTSDKNSQRCEHIKPASIDLCNIESYEHLLGEADSIVYLVGPGSLLRNNVTDILIQDYLVNFSTFLEVNSRNKNCPIVFSSSGGAVYGTGAGVPFTETTLLKPINPYGLLKLLSENLLEYYFNNKSTKFISLRISNPFGGSNHTKTDQGVINIFLKKALDNRPVEIWGNDDLTRDYIFMPDLMSAFEASIRCNDFSGALNIGGGVGTSLAQLCNIIENVLGLPLKKHYKAKNKFLADHIVLNISKAESILQWSPQYSVSDGVIDLVNEMK